MLETPHAVLGATIAVKTGNPWLALPLAFVSHFILDATPHWNPHLNTEKRQFGKITVKTRNLVILDTITALVLCFSIAFLKSDSTSHFITIIMASFFAVLPDVLEGPYFFLNWKNHLVEKWIIFQKSIQNDAGIVFGLTTQVITLLVMFFWLFQHNSQF